MSLLELLAGRRVYQAGQSRDDHHFRGAFVESWPAIRDGLAQVRAPGILVAAVDRRPGGPVSITSMSATADMPAVSIIGRNRMCDIVVDDAGLADRHLAVLLEPLDASTGSTGSTDLVLRVMDLRTDTHFADEHGHAVEAVIATGATFLSFGRHALFILTTGDELDPSLDADDAWECIPERVYLNERRANERGQVRRQPRWVASPSPHHSKPPSVISTVPGPARATLSLVEQDDREVATVEVRTHQGPDTRMQRITIGEQAANHGVLVGRHPICDTWGATAMQSGLISRVHMLLLRIGEATYALDTRSTHGTHHVVPGVGSIRKPVVRLSPDAELILGDDIARLCWRPV